MAAVAPEAAVGKVPTTIGDALVKDSLRPGLHWPVDIKHDPRFAWHNQGEGRFARLSPADVDVQVVEDAHPHTGRGRYHVLVDTLPRHQVVRPQRAVTFTPSVGSEQQASFPLWGLGIFLVPPVLGAIKGGWKGLLGGLGVDAGFVSVPGCGPGPAAIVTEAPTQAPTQAPATAISPEVTVTPMVNEVLTAPPVTTETPVPIEGSYPTTVAALDSAKVYSYGGAEGRDSMDQVTRVMFDRYIAELARQGKIAGSNPEELYRSFDQRYDFKLFVTDTMLTRLIQSKSDPTLFLVPVNANGQEFHDLQLSNEYLYKGGQVVSAGEDNFDFKEFRADRVGGIGAWPILVDVDPSGIPVRWLDMDRGGVETPIQTASTVTIEAPLRSEEERLAGAKPEGEGITLNIDKARWENDKGQLWSPEVNAWVDLRNADGKDIFLLGGPTDFYGSSPTFPLRIYSKQGELTSMGSFAHPAGYDEEFGPDSGNWFNFSIPTQLVSLLTEVKYYPIPKEQLTKGNVDEVLQEFRDKSFELLIKIPSNAKDPNSYTQATCKLGKGIDVFVVNWKDANPATDPAFYETNGIRWKLQCDQNTNRTTEIVAFPSSHQEKDVKIRLGVLGPFFESLYNYGVIPTGISRLDDKVTSMAQGENETIDGVRVKNSFIESVPK